MGYDHGDDRYDAGFSHGKVIMKYFVDDVGPPSRRYVDFSARSILPTVWDTLMSIREHFCETFQRVPKVSVAIVRWESVRDRAVLVLSSVLQDTDLAGVSSSTTARWSVIYF